MDRVSIHQLDRFTIVLRKIIKNNGVFITNYHNDDKNKTKNSSITLDIKIAQNSDTLAFCLFTICILVHCIYNYKLKQFSADPGQSPQKYHHFLLSEKKTEKLNWSFWLPDPSSASMEWDTQTFKTVFFIKSYNYERWSRHDFENLRRIRFFLLRNNESRERRRLIGAARDHSFIFIYYIL